MTDIQVLQAEVATLTATINAQNNRITALDRALATLQASVTPTPAPDISTEVQETWDDFVSASGNFFTGHIRHEMELPVGLQDGAHSVYTCPSGRWTTESVVAYMNGRALPDSYLTQRSATSFRLGGGFIPELWPDLTISERKELRVSYDLISSASGEITPSGLMSRQYSYIDFTGYYSAFQPFGVTVSASGTAVLTDTFFEWPSPAINFTQDTEVIGWLNGNRLRKDPAIAWVAATAYQVDDRIIVGGSGIYQCNTFHTSSGTFPPTIANWDVADPYDYFWVNSSGAMTRFDIDPEDIMIFQVPRYATASGA